MDRLMRYGISSELLIRTISGAVMAAVAMLAMWLGRWPFGVLLVIIGVLMIVEWNRLTRNLGSDFKLLGIAYVLFPTASLMIIRNGHHGLWTTFWTLAIVWSTDIGAYFSGRYFGGPKLAPSISPAKTWSGLVGGAVTAGVAGPIIASGGDLPLLCYILGAPLGLVAQGGDLFESWLKRQAGVKDSGSILPGHGGVLDRLDGAVPVATIVCLLKVFNAL